MRQVSFGENGNLWLEKTLAGLRFRQIIRQIKLIKNLETVVDLGCGYRAENLRKIVKIFPDIKLAVGVDLSVAEAAISSKIKLVAADLNKTLPLPDESADAVISLAVIEHLANPEFTVSEACRVLKTGGCFIFTTPSPRAKKIVELLAFKLGMLDKTEIADHKNYFTRPELERMLSRAGFKNIKIKTFQFGLNILAACKK